jgi:Ner family transcriptional regulator
MLTEADKRLLKNPSTRRVWIRYQLALRNLTLAELAQKADVSPENVSKVWRRPFPKVESLLAEALGVKARDLFPERYCDAGNSKVRPVGRPRAAV